MDNAPGSSQSQERKNFLSSFDDIDQFLEASVSVAEGENKTADVTTDLGSSTSMLSPVSPMPNLNRSHGSGTRNISGDPIAEAAIEEELTATTSTEESGGYRLPNADTPMPGLEEKEESDRSPEQTSSDEITVHQDSDSLNTEALKLMAGVQSTENRSLPSGSSSPQKPVQVVEQPASETPTSSDVVEVQPAGLLGDPKTGLDLGETKGTLPSGNLLDKGRHKPHNPM